MLVVGVRETCCCCSKYEEIMIFRVVFSLSANGQIYIRGVSVASEPPGMWVGIAYIWYYYYYYYELLPAR